MDELLEKWRDREHHRNHLFISDGVVDSEAWGKTTHKVLFVLKEAYDEKRTEGTWDLSTLIRRRKVSGRTLKPMAQWAYGVQQVLKHQRISEFREKGQEVEKALMSSAVLNLKKSGGANKSSYKNLQNYVEKDWDLIARQIEIIRPDIVICGKTWSLLSNMIEEKSRVSDQVARVNGIPYVSFWHPANRASNKMCYYSLCALVLQALESGEL